MTIYTYIPALWHKSIAGLTLILGGSIKANIPIKTKFYGMILGSSESGSNLNPSGYFSLGNSNYAKANTLSPLFARVSFISSIVALSSYDICTTCSYLYVWVHMAIIFSGAPFNIIT